MQEEKNKIEEADNGESEETIREKKGKERIGEKKKQEEEVKS